MNHGIHAQYANVNGMNGIWSKPDVTQDVRTTGSVKTVSMGFGIVNHRTICRQIVTRPGNRTMPAGEIKK